MAVKALIMAALPLLVLSSEVKQCSYPNTISNGLPVLDSLKCINDYTTHINCTWEEDPHTHSHLLINTDFSNETACTPEGHGVHLPNGKVQRSCVYKTEVFSWSTHSVSFSTSCPTTATTLNIAQHGKVLSPVNVSEREADGGGRMLNWNSPYPPSSILTNTLIYQLRYRRHGYDWTVVDNINTTELLIKKQELSPGYLYEAKVRARGRTGLWSDWSSPVSWTTEEEGVINLQCVIQTGGVLCSWHVKRDQAQFLSFYLCWQTNGSSQSCELCLSNTKSPGRAVANFKCSVNSSEPELLTMEIKSVRGRKIFTDSKNIQPPAPKPVEIKKKDGLWKVTWSKPNIRDVVFLSYELHVRNNDTQVYEEFKVSENNFFFDITPSSLMPSTSYMVQIRAIPSQKYEGKPSDWSEPVYFRNDPASWIVPTIYVLTGLFMAAFSIILYNALPACHRRLEIWKVSIPSPIKSRVLEEMSSKRCPAVWSNLYSENEKTSVCIMQPSDNPVICKGSISEYPLLSRSSDSLIKSEWTQGVDHSPSYTEGSGMSVKSVMSFTGPYILCLHQDSSSQTELLDKSFYSHSTFEEDSKSITENSAESSPLNEGYVSSPPTSLSSVEHSNDSDSPTNESKSSQSQLPAEEPPAYTPNPTAMPGVLFSHTSDYFLMPSMEVDIAAWVQASAPSPGCATERSTESQLSNKGDGGQSARGYVTLSQSTT
ncbi:cytokine receptor common subunit beta [Hoplias malabaricus]|uniref:cytokine receptor common subunit beta n=1 Tax=Hoplias malabaricus TaxID=27720 RepID=UPI003462D0CD